MLTIGLNTLEALIIAIVAVQFHRALIAADISQRSGLHDGLLVLVPLVGQFHALVDSLHVGSKPKALGLDGLEVADGRRPESGDGLQIGDGGSEAGDALLPEEGAGEARGFEAARPLAHPPSAGHGPDGSQDRHPLGQGLGNLRQRDGLLFLFLFVFAATAITIAFVVVVVVVDL